MSLLNDIQHLTFLTADMGRLIAFYERVFEAKLVMDMVEEGLRHSFIEVGGHTILHPFQIPGIEPPPWQPMFQRGRIDHFALMAADEAAFREIYRRLVAEGACDGTVTDMGAMWILTFIDPDGGSQEVVWMKPNEPLTHMRNLADWTTFVLE